MSSDRSLSASLGSVLTGDNAAYLEQIRADFEHDPQSVDPTWHLALSLLSDRQPDITSLLRTRGHTVAALDPIQSNLISSDAAGRAKRLHPHAGAAEYQRLAEVYCGGLGLETEHIDSLERRQWAYRAFESYQPSPGWLVEFMRLTAAASEFERLMHTKFPTKKRFGAEGAEAIVPLVRRILMRLAARGVERVVIGTMHRGRLNILTNALDRPLELTLAEFSGKHPFDSGTAADVPYHLGWQTKLDIAPNSPIEIDLLPNPSHLEAVNSVALGKARGLHDADGKRTAALILHTDASVIGQGSVAEIIQFAGLEGFTTGGTIHLVINNQIGFTTNPDEARTSKYCTGAWKATDSLILHVNSESAVDIVKAADIGVDYRCAHGLDAVIDLVCYRRNGHNEIDEPRFTQPLLYQLIERHPPFVDTLARQLTDAGVLAGQKIENWKRSYAEHFLTTFDSVKKSLADVKSATASKGYAAEATTGGCDLDQLAGLLSGLAEEPEGFTLDPRLRRIMRGRRDLVETGVNWPTAEALAIASLNEVGVPVRLSGQDVVRGAFSHRHFDLANQETGERRRQIGRVGQNRSLFDAINSPLSEYAVLGFEYGYSLARPDCLTIWEAQFGDFANGAQIIIDQFVSSAKEKWDIDTGLIMLLPHGLDGQGPEHSSARIERLLQLSEPDNMDVVQPSTPANYFHLLRTQAMRKHKRPLALIGAKALLRHPLAISPFRDFGPDTRFQKVLSSRPMDARRPAGVIFCSGKISYELEFRIEEQGVNARVVRIEQIAPFPEMELVQEIKRCPASSFTYVQEEPANMGALAFVEPRLYAVLEEAGYGEAELHFVSRPASGSPAGSFHGLHDAHQAELIARAVSLCAPKGGRAVDQSANSANHRQGEGNAFER